MGGCTGKDTKTDYEIFNFKKEDFEQIRKCFHRISNYKAKYLVKRTIGKKGLQNEFQENPEFALKLYKWMVQEADGSVVTLESFVRSVERLTQDPTEADLKDTFVHRFDILETTTVISIEKHAFDREDIAKLTITYSQGLRFMKEILNIFRYTKSTQYNDLAAKIVVNSIFTGSDSKIIDFNNFIFNLSRQFLYLSHYLKIYYNSKFIDRDLRRSLRVPSLDNYSTVLNDDIVSLFTLTCNYFHDIDQLTLLYSKSYYGSSFTDLLYSLKGYEGPTLILLKHIERDTGSQANPKHNSVHVFGGFSSTPWEEELSYQGNGECFLFSLIPKFKKYYSLLGEGGQNYLYMNGKKVAHSKYKVGLGFGGINYESFRIWIDENLETGSYTCPGDHTYEKGSLIDPTIKELNIGEIEIWGLGGQTALAKQDMYRMHEGIDFKRPRRKVPISSPEDYREEALESADGRLNTEGEPQAKVGPEEDQDIGNLPILGWKDNQEYGINAE